jgi:hypothetical protein
VIAAREGAMARSSGGGGGMGFVLAVVVLLIVLLLAAKAWNVMLPEAAQAMVPGLRPAPRAADPNAQPASATRPSGMPDLKEMGQNTDRHIQAVQDATAKQD